MHHLQQLLPTLTGKTVIIRADLNVPRDEAGNITDDARIVASLASIQACLQAGAKVAVTSHLDRPAEGQYDARYSLDKITQRLSELLSMPTVLQQNWVDTPWQAQADTLTILENCRFLRGEKANNVQLSQNMAALADVWVHDAFGAAHRAEASTYGVFKYARMACAGFLLSQEYQALSQALLTPARPVLAVVGGSKVSTKLSILQNLVDKVDQLIVGGGIANTFLAAQGHAVGKSLYEKDLLPEAQAIMKAMQKKNSHGILLPLDVVVAKNFAADAPVVCKNIDAVQSDDMILDVGPATQKHLAGHIAQARTIVWNGPLGVFEFASCAGGTQALAQAIAQSKSFSIAGGGDTLAAIAAFDVRSGMDYISTGGGAFLEFLEGKCLPAFEVLENAAKKLSA